MTRNLKWRRVKAVVTMHWQLVRIFLELSYVLYFDLNPLLSASDLSHKETRLCTLTKTPSPDCTM